MYRHKIFVGEDASEKLWIHLCDGARVEFHAATVAVFSREQFEQLVLWIQGEFERLERAPKPWIN